MSDVVIGKILPKILKEKHLTVKELAKQAKVPASTLGEWVNNRPPRNPTQVRAVAKFLDVSMHFLLFGEEDSQEPIQKILKEDVLSGTFEISIKRVTKPGG